MKIGMVQEIDVVNGSAADALHTLWLSVTAKQNLLSVLF